MYYIIIIMPSNYTDNTNNNTNNITSKYQLCFCNLVHPDIIGYVQGESDPEISNHFMVVSTVIDSDTYNNNNEDPEDSDSDNEVIDIRTASIEDLIDFNMEIASFENKCVKKHFKKYLNDHPTLRNYEKIIFKNIFVKPQIVEKLYLRGDECVAIIKTMWIKFIQRKWKKIFKQRKEILEKRKNINNIFIKERNISWTVNNNELPELRGMLYNYKFDF